MLQLNLQKPGEKSHMSERQSVSAVPNAEPQLDWFWTFFPCYCNCLTRHIKRMTTCQIILIPTTKEPKICHALATTSAFNLKLCHTIFLADPGKAWGFMDHPTVHSCEVRMGGSTISGATLSSYLHFTNSKLRDHFFLICHAIEDKMKIYDPS